MHAFDVLGDPVRRRILELLAENEQGSGALANIIQKEFSITQGAVSQHLKILRDSNFANSRKDGVRRIYSIEEKAFQETHLWLNRFRQLWEPKLDAFAMEIAKGKKQRNPEQ